MADGPELEIEESTGSRRVKPSDFPLSLGGDGCAVLLPGEDGTAAWLAQAEGDLFIQPEPGHALIIDGRPMRESHWVSSGDRIGLGAHRLSFDSGQSGLVLRVETVDEANRTEPPMPRLKPPPRAKPSAAASVEGASASGGEGIRPIDFQPAIRPDGTSARGPRWGRWLALFPLITLGSVAAMIFTARSVGVTIEPAADSMVVESSSLLTHGLQLGDRFLMWPGRYEVRAEKAGYHPLTREIEVGRESRQDFRFELELLPGEVVFHSKDAASGGELAGIAVAVDGEPMGEVPLTLELEAGSYNAVFSHPRYRSFETRLEVQGGGESQGVTAELEGRWAEVRITSRPSGARLRVDGEDRGVTTAELELIEGVRRFELIHPGRKPYRGKIEVVAGEPMEVGPVDLRPSDGNLVITSEPAEAEVTVSGVYRGRTPLDLRLAPGADYRIRVAKAGYAAETRTVSLRSEQMSEASFVLEQQLGRVLLDVFPPGAEIRLDGRPVEPVDGGLDLPVKAHTLEVASEGYVPFRQEITPLSGVEQSVVVRLETQAAAKEREIQSRLTTVEGHRLVLVEPGRLKMGASRREAGRRANEALREVELTRRFFIGAHEISNAQFRRFKADHLSGGVGGQNLELDPHPVVRVTWQDAVAYCNWLSRKEGLPEAYVKSGEIWVQVSPMNEGFRLPTEAEWAWVARYDADGSGPRKYPWGEKLPPSEAAGNFADQSAASLIEAVLGTYKDGFPATAPVDAFGADSRGIFQLGGNVAEWIHDVYKPRPAAIGAVERDPIGPPKGEHHVIRGASWMHSTITELRWSFRDYGSEARPDLGFRIARYADGGVP